MGTTTGNRHLFITVGTYGGTILCELVDPIKKIQGVFGESFNPEFIAIDTNTCINNVIAPHKDVIKTFCLTPKETKGRGSGTNAKVAFDAWKEKSSEFVDQFRLDEEGIESATVIAALGKGGTAAGCALPVSYEFIQRGIATVPFLIMPATVVNEVGTCQRGYSKQVIGQFDELGIPIFHASGNWIFDNLKTGRELLYEEAEKMVTQQFRDALLKIALFWIWGTMIDPADIKGRLLRKRPGANPRLKFAESPVALSVQDSETEIEQAVHSIKDHELYDSNDITDVIYPFLMGKWTVTQVRKLHTSLATHFGDKIHFSKPARVPLMDSLENKTAEDLPGGLVLLFRTVTKLSEVEDEMVPNFHAKPVEAEVEVNTESGVMTVSAGQYEEKYSYRYGTFRKLLETVLRGEKERVLEATHILFEGDPNKLKTKQISDREDGGRPHLLFDFDMVQSKFGQSLIRFGKDHEDHRLPDMELLLAVLDAHRFRTCSFSEQVSFSLPWESFLLGSIESALRSQGQALPRYIIREWYSVIPFNSQGMTPERLRKDTRWESQWQKWRKSGDPRAELLMLRVILENLFGEEKIKEQGIPHEPKETRSVYVRGKDALGMWVERHGWGQVKRLARSLKPAKTKTSPVVSMEIREPTKQVNGHPPVPVAVEEFAKTQVSTTLQ